MPAQFGSSSLPNKNSTALLPVDAGTIGELQGLVLDQPQASCLGLQGIGKLGDTVVLKAQFADLGAGACKKLVELLQLAAA